MSRRTAPTAPSTTSNDQLFDQLCRLLANLHREHEVKAFLDQFLTKAEKVTFAKRLGIAQELGSGKSYEQIAKHLKVSSATISGVGSALKSAPVQIAMRYLAADNWWRRLLRRP